MNRKQYFAVDNQESSMQFIKCGVPQGSVLGSVLFLLFINDILCNVSNLQFVLFADDTKMFCSNENVAVLQDTLNRELAKLFGWFSINKLSLNLGKTNYMVFRSRPPDLVPYFNRIFHIAKKYGVILICFKCKMSKYLSKERCEVNL